MEIQNNIIKHYLRNVYFITGTAYAGKSTMVKLLAEKHDMIFCGENYHSAVAEEIKTPENQPASCYFETMSGWQEFLNRSPEDYYSWICQSAKEVAQMEIAQLIHLAASGKRIVVDTNIPVEILHEISDYHHVAIMLSPQAMSVERFFDRDDPEKKFLFDQISLATDSQKTMNNFRNCIAKLNSQEEYNRHADSGFFTLVRKDADVDTKEQVLVQLERHFGLRKPNLCYCGHDCSCCVTYLATINDDDNLRRQAKNFYQSAMGHNVPLEKINCMGGRSENIFFQCASCPWMKCCKERGVSACSECSEYPCKPIAEYEEKYVNKCNQIHGCEK